MSAGQEIEALVEHAIRDNARNEPLFYRSVDYNLVRESVAKQRAACQKLRDNGWKVYGCAWSMLHHDASFCVAAAKNSAPSMKEEYDSWKAYKERYADVFEMH